MIVRWLNMFIKRVDLDMSLNSYSYQEIVKSIKYEMENFKFEKSAELIKGNNSKSLSYIVELNVLPPLIGILYKRNVLKKYYKKDIMSGLNYSTGRKFPRKMNHIDHYEAFIKVNDINDIIGILFLSDNSVNEYLSRTPSCGCISLEKRKERIKKLYENIKHYCNDNGIKVIEKDLAF